MSASMATRPIPTTRSTARAEMIPAGGARAVCLVARAQRPPELIATTRDRDTESCKRWPDLKTKGSQASYFTMTVPSGIVIGRTVDARIGAAPVRDLDYDFDSANAYRSLVPTSALRLRRNRSRPSFKRSYGFGVTRFAPVALLTFTTLSGRRSCGGCYRQILGPDRHLPKFANRLGRYSDIAIHLDPHHPKRS
jgi:hypothetical protein